MSANAAAEPRIELVKKDGEVTLLIDGVQAMQAWERELMWRSADMLCEGGGDFLEVGLGLGLSALRIARKHNVRSHTVIEKHGKVIELFRQENADAPTNLKIIHSDFFDYVDRLQPQSFDGIFFDPELPKALFEDAARVNDFMPKLVRALRPGGGFVPMFSIGGDVPDAATCTASPSIMLDRWLRFFDRVTIERQPFTAYTDTVYTDGTSGDAFILVFRKE